jgi:hypothetical protein
MKMDTWNIALLNFGQGEIIRPVSLTPPPPPQPPKQVRTAKQEAQSRQTLILLNAKRRERREADYRDVLYYLNTYSEATCRAVALRFCWSISKAGDILGELSKQGRAEKIWINRDCLWKVANAS